MDYLDTVKFFITPTNPIESMFATVRLRTHKVKSCGSRTTSLAMIFKLSQMAEKNWIKLRGFKLLADVLKGVKFKNGERVEEEQLTKQAI